MNNLVPLVHDWAVRCFGKAHVGNVRVRSLRLAEEAIELCQAAGLDEKKMHSLVTIVYGRPRGEPVQELAGVFMTACVLCGTLGLDPQDVLLAELRRVLQKPPAFFRERNEEKVRLGLDA